MINEVRLIGRLGDDPKVSYTTKGEAVAGLSVATTEKWTDKATGEKVEATEWHKCVAYGKTAEVCKEYLAKGDLVFVAGKLKTKKWQDAAGNNRYTTEVVINAIKMLSTPQQKRPKQPRIDKNAPGDMETRVDEKKSTVGGFDAIDDDIPFAPYMAGKASLSV